MSCRPGLAAVPRGLFCLFVLWASASPAEIVVLDNGRFLTVSAYHLEGERMRLELDRGGELVLSVTRIERIIEDEISSAVAAPVLDLPEDASIDLGFPEDAPVPDVPFGEFIHRFSQERDVNPRLVVAIVRAESAFDVQAVSPKGARGLMQLMPATGRSLGVAPQELFDAEINISAGVRYLGRLLEQYSSDLPLVLAAYNAGEGAVERYRGVPPYTETRNYIRRIYGFLGIDPPPDQG